jgi:hypothetical protein
MMPVETTARPEKTQRKALWLVKDQKDREVVAFCPSCKAMETITIHGREVALGRKFILKDGTIFHACGSKVPCRLYGLS